MKRTLCVATFGVMFISHPIFAEQPSPSASSVPEAAASEEAAAYIPPSALSDALSSPPPERARHGRAWATDEARLLDIDAWIEQTSVDAPQNLIMRDILLAMPIQKSGPRLVALAKKSKDASIQATWDRHLRPYPAAYAKVIIAWILQSTSPQRTYELLCLLDEHEPPSALKLWAVLIANHPIDQLDNIATFGLHREGALDALYARLPATRSDEHASLRLYRAIIRVLEARPTAVLSSDHAILESDISAYLDHKAVSRRIVALDLIAAFRLAAYLPQARTRFAQAKNTTEKAHAMRAIVLQEVPVEERLSLLSQALSNGDEIMRLTAANLLEDAPDVLSALDADQLRQAFQKEIWPETQLKLYRALSTRLSDPAFHREVLLDPQLTPSTRLAALKTLTEHSQAAMPLSLEDLATLQRHESPVELIAATAESLYEWKPTTRPTLQQWLVVQRPFERRLLLTFSRFIQSDRSIPQTTVPEYIREICRHGAEDENTLQPCIAYFEDNAATDDDKNLLHTLQTRKKQFDMMLDF